ncbi:MAG: HAD family hydrolase [Bryobacteraceae bacterium]
MHPEAVFLFDIDGTLIRKAGDHHRQALVDSVLDVTGLHSSLDGIATQGMLDGDIVRRMLRNCGLDDASIEEKIPRVFQRAQEIYRCPALQEKVCPGVVELLNELRRREIPMGLVTGNLSAIAWRKMESAGLRQYFRFGAFAEMADTRAGLVGLALAQARELKLPGQKIQVAHCGDHPNDVEAAKLNGIRSIAVATGISSFEELSDCSPDILLNDMCSFDLTAIFENDSFSVTAG